MRNRILAAAKPRSAGRFGLEGRRMVVFLGGGYEANGHAPKGGIYERHFYTGFPTTEEALFGPRRAVARTPGTALIFKPGQNRWTQTPLRGN